VEAVFRREIFEGVGLTCVRTQKFKTGVLSMTFVDRLSKETAAKNALLPKVLRRATVRHATMESMEHEMQELFGAEIEPVVRKKGENQLFGLRACFADDFFVGGEKVLDKTASLMGEMLLDPVTFGGRLAGEFVDSERDNLLDEIRAVINDKRQYASLRLAELMCRDEAYGIPRLGSESAAKRITAASLTKHYRDRLASSPMEIVYCGSAEPVRVEQAVRYALAQMPRTGVRKIEKTDVPEFPEGRRLRRFSEKLDVTQGKLSIGFRLAEPALGAMYAPYMLMNALYGGAVTSKLFENVREKLSLCYYASSAIEKYKGLMIVSSGIEFEKYEESFGEIMRQFDAVRAGDFTDKELEDARRSLITSLRTLGDSPRRTEEFYLDAALTDVPLTPGELARMVSHTTAAQIVSAAGQVRPDTVYFLSGKEADA